MIEAEDEGELRVLFRFGGLLAKIARLDGVKRLALDLAGYEGQSPCSLTDLVHAIREYRKLVDQKPLTLQGSDFAQAVQELKKAIDRAEGLLLQ